MSQRVPTTELSHNLSSLLHIIPPINVVVTHVPERGLKYSDYPIVILSACESGIDVTHEDFIVKILDSLDHPGVNSMLYFVKRAHPAITRRQVRAVVPRCEACQSIDSVTVKWQKGRLDVKEVWQRVGMYISQ